MQVEHLKSLVKDFNDHAIIEKIASFAIDLAARKESTEEQLESNPAPYFHGKPQDFVEDILGMLISLVDQDCKNAASLINPASLDDTCLEIEKGFALQIGARLARFESQIEKHRTFKLQDEKKISAARLPIEIADILVASDGCLNFGLCKRLKYTFTGSEHPPHPFNSAIANALDLLENSSEARLQLQSITPPSHPGGFIDDVIRAALGMHPAEPITANDAKKTALSAFLSNLRQGSAGTCFATAFALDKLRTRPMDCLKDFAELLETGKLKRKVDNEWMEFVFLTNFPGETSDTKIEIDCKGDLLREKKSVGKIWEAPGIMDACRAAGILEVELFVSRALVELRKAGDGISLKISIQALIEKTVSLAYHKRFELGEAVSVLINRALLTFEALVQSPLLRVWEYTIASMAEARSSDGIKASILNASLVPIHDKLAKIRSIPQCCKKEAEKEIKKVLSSRLKLIYDPSLPRIKPGKTCPSDFGAFVCYDSKGASDPFEWQRVDDRAKYVGFITALLGEAKKKQISGMETLFLHTLEPYTRIHRYVQTKKFLRASLRECHLSNAADENLAEHLPTLKQTPWVMFEGSNPEQVDHVYHNSEPLFASKPIFCYNAKTLFQSLIRFAREQPEKLKTRLKQNPHLSQLMSVKGVHAFSLLLGHPTLVNAWSSELSPADWINEFVWKPGVSIADEDATPLTRSLVLDYIKDSLLEPKNRSSFDRLVREIAEPMTIKDFRAKIEQTLKHFFTDEKPLRKTLLKLDSYLADKSLPADQKQKLHETIVHFADTNWGEGIHDLHFCFLVNPGTGQLEIWTIQENGTNLEALKQNRWAVESMWEISLKKNDQYL